MIADVVRSREHADQVALHDRLLSALARSTATHPATRPLGMTTGSDEFQGSYDTLGAALAATVDLRLDLLPTVDIRCGIARGASTTLTDRPGGADGPAWWAARAAIELVEDRASKPATATARVWYSADDDPRAPAVNAALASTDQLLAALDERGLRLLAGLRAGRSQAQLATAEKISESAVSQRIRRSGALAIVTAAQLLSELD
ncbi:RNA polymerase subunit sigma-70 [Calidifontibacter sp. DB0510]|uniref:RNA polymerase subunit sigma-70 n=1 Tax=Metallococcus carri TaxID=1656884 RepID=A0A967B5S8_9MICO|nr:RNA polymerase subunit sigma-70 [Metallococcus carri]NOP37416.1 RNA polymerase subunit sigma-70 [Calidifontibacter sp. DB2511S]